MERTKVIGFRVGNDQVLRYEIAADEAGLTISDWARSLCDAAVLSGKAKDIAAKIPGLTVGMPSKDKDGW